MSTAVALVRHNDLALLGTQLKEELLEKYDRH